VRSGARPEQVDAMRAEVRSLEALVDNYKVDVERTELTSPIDGQIVTPRVQELAGTYLKPGQRDLIVQIEDPRTIQAVVEVPRRTRQRCVSARRSRSSRGPTSTAPSWAR